jgi:hypothetical protein
MMSSVRTDLSLGASSRPGPSTPGTRWMWSLVDRQHENRTPTHGYKPTREAVMQAFAKSWHHQT